MRSLMTWNTHLTLYRYLAALGGSSLYPRPPFSGEARGLAGAIDSWLDFSNSSIAAALAQWQAAGSEKVRLDECHARISNHCRAVDCWQNSSNGDNKACVWSNASLPHSITSVAAPEGTPAQLFFFKGMPAATCLTASPCAAQHANKALPPAILILRYWAQEADAARQRLIQAASALEAHLAGRTYVAGHSLSLADLVLAADLKPAFEQVSTCQRNFLQFLKIAFLAGVDGMHSH